MSLSVVLFCDVCGRSVEPVTCTDLAPRGAIKAAKVARGWLRIKFSAHAETQDVCPGCAADAARFNAHADRVRKAHARGGCPLTMACKARPPLTPDLQRLVELALPAAMWVAATYERAYGPALDWRGQISLRLCEHAGEYDPGRSKLVTWAASHAHYACRELLRAEVPAKARSRSKRRIGVALSLDVAVSSRGESFAALVPDRRPAEAEDPAGAARLLRGLTAAERAVVWALVVEGRTWAEVGDTLGLSSSRINQLKNQALNRLREIRINDQLK